MKLPRGKPEEPLLGAELGGTNKGEKCKKYFFNLEKRSYEQRQISKLKISEHNKTPGTDGLSAELYLRFWNDISCPLIDSLNYSAFVGELSISQRQGIISSIPKKNKDPLLLKNGPPNTLLNVDYKLATKCIARRLEKVLPHLIERDQTGHIKGRYIGDNIRAVSDIIEQHQNKEGMILF